MVKTRLDSIQMRLDAIAKIVSLGLVPVSFILTILNVKQTRLYKLILVPAKISFIHRLVPSRFACCLVGQIPPKLSGIKTFLRLIVIA